MKIEALPFATGRAIIERGIPAGWYVASEQPVRVRGRGRYAIKAGVLLRHGGTGDYAIIDKDGRQLDIEQTAARAYIERKKGEQTK